MKFITILQAAALAVLAIAGAQAASDIPAHDATPAVTEVPDL